MIWKNKLFRLGAAFLLLLLLLSSLNSCQLLYLRYSETPGTAGTVGSSAATRDISTPPSTAPDFGIHLDTLDSGYEAAAAVADGLEREDYSGAAFLICTAAEATHTLLPEETDPLYAACLKRNALITDVYQNTLFCSSASMEDLRKDLAASVKAGSGADTYYADLLEIPAADAYSLINSGLLLSLRALPFYTTATQGSEGAGFYRNSKNCFDTSAATYCPTDVYCLYFNTELAGEDLTKTLYDAGLDGTLSFELLCVAAQDAAKEDVPYDICGNFSAGTFGNLAFVRSGNRYTATVNGYPQLSTVLTASETVDTLLASLRGLRWSGYLPSEEEPAPVSSSAGSSAIVPEKEPNGYDAFISGKALFYVGTAGEISNLSEKALRWGILPLPGDANAENVEIHRSVLCVPANNSRLEMTGRMLTALQKVSGDWMAREYAISAAQNLLRDNNSYFTLCKAITGASFCDFAELCGSGCKNLTAATYDAVAKAMETGTALSEVVKPLQTAVNNALKKLN